MDSTHVEEKNAVNLKSGLSIHDSKESVKMTVKSHRLFPPFLQKEDSDLVQDKDAKRRASLFDETQTISAKVTLQDRITMCTNIEDEILESESANLGEEIMRTPYVFCEDDCRMNYLACDELAEETKSFVEITDSELYDVHELRDEDYQGWDEDEEDEGEDGRHEGRRGPPWAFVPCESFSSLSEAEEDPTDTTDPYLSHKLKLPYSKTIRPRYYKVDEDFLDYIPMTLPRRPRSPVRKILPGMFDLKSAYEAWRKKRRLTEVRRYLRQSKDRIRQSIKQLSAEQLVGDNLISSVVLEAVCEQVTLTLTGVVINTDVHTFVNIAVIWALTELKLFSLDMLTSEQSRLSRDLGLFDGRARAESDDLESDGLRKTLLGAYRAPFNRGIDTTLHRRLPWSYVGPSHQRGHTKFYPNVRERIDEKEPRGEEDTSVYVPDVKCFHLKELLDKPYVAYRRRSKYFNPPTTSSMKLLEQLFVQLISFM